jgi:hypothetical protein
MIDGDGEARPHHHRRGEGSHAVYVSQPQAVASIIVQAAKGVTVAAR